MYVRMCWSCLGMSICAHAQTSLIRALHEDVDGVVEGKRRFLATEDGENSTPGHSQRMYWHGRVQKRVLNAVMAHDFEKRTQRSQSTVEAKTAELQDIICMRTPTKITNTYLATKF